MRHCYVCNKPGVPIKNGLCERCENGNCSATASNINHLQRGDVGHPPTNAGGSPHLERQRKKVRKILMEKWGKS